mmetsp:Transcript_91439/g.279846  ORF Transcript_91439/g.279846 Transcript_91439/m.279846 type:complete len:223 (-) Transcript_91439:466-1134(-)
MSMPHSLRMSSTFSRSVGVCNSTEQSKFLNKSSKKKRRSLLPPAKVFDGMPMPHFGRSPFVMRSWILAQPCSIRAPRSRVWLRKRLGHPDGTQCPTPARRHISLLRRPRAPTLGTSTVEDKVRRKCEASLDSAPSSSIMSASAWMPMPNMMAGTPVCWRRDVNLFASFLARFWNPMSTRGSTTKMLAVDSTSVSTEHELPSSHGSHKFVYGLMSRLAPYSQT